jgi:RHS repeat-associated protein
LEEKMKLLSNNTGISYYPFGMQMPARSYKPADYRFGFNGQEKETEITNTESHYGTEYWMYDSRLGRRWNIDPVKKQHESSYATFANTPIWAIDPLGNDTILFNSSGKFANKKLKDDKNDFDVLLQVSNKELKKGQIDYKKDGSLRSRHLNMQTTKDGFSFVSNRRKIGNEKINYSELSLFKDNVRGDESYRIYEFLVNSTSVEFSYIFSVNGTIPRINITTSQERYSERYGSILSSIISKTEGSAIFVHIHSHPVYTEREKKEYTILPDQRNPSTADKDFKRSINEKQLKREKFTPSFYIYFQGVLYDY